MINDVSAGCLNGVLLLPTPLHATQQQNVPLKTAALVNYACRNSALSIGNTYTELLGELGRSVGAGANLGLGFLTSGAGRALNPLQLGLDALNFELNNLVSFLQVGTFMPAS